MKRIDQLCSLAFVLGVLVILLTACDREKPVKGFVLPEGNVEKGKEAFVGFGCNGCHDVAGVELPERRAKPPFVVELGGEVLRVKEYGELLTAVVYPNHVISAMYKDKLVQAGKNPSQTPMPYYGDIMTVTELTDLVAFLHAQYSLRPPELYRQHYYIP
jgi:mono/diheme cytochrome c family protein